MTGMLERDAEPQRSATAPSGRALDVTAPASVPAADQADRSPESRRRRRSSRSEEAGTPTRAAVIDVRIEPGDPLLPLLATAPGPLDMSVLPDFSPAVAHLKEQGTQMVVPLVASGELVGVLALGPRRSERTYTRNDLRLLDSLARYAAPALRLGQLMRQQEGEARAHERIEQELHVARLIQQQFLPSELPELPGWHVAAFYQPARTVGGDFYDLIELADGRIMVVTGDVTDKGVPAALVMASTHALLRSTAEVATSPGEVLSRVNELLIPQIPINMFVTCLVLIIDPASGRTTFANAGHNLPYVRRGDRVVQLFARGMPLGLMPGSAYEEHETVIEPGDIVMLYSDGITEQHDARGEMFGFGRTEAVVATASSGEELVDATILRLHEFSLGMEQEDDITVVSLHRGRSGSADDVISFSVPSDPGNEREAMERVAAIVGDALPPVRLDSLKTAVSETTMNAIEHGNRGRPELSVDIAVHRSPEAVTVEVADFGRGQQREAEIPDLDLKLAGLQKPRGWGLFLVERLVDRVEELAAGDKHIVRLVMHLEVSEPNPQEEGS
jgi:serine phosphatase RsbU (regulator of sigma subunit)/anti-sigma regulatory factor (Ser/Thr protein kinase)